MKILAIDTTSKNLNIALNLNGEISGVFIKDCQLTHSEILMKKIDELILKQGLNLSDFDFFGCCNGPGSFTGIRIGVTIIRAFAQIFNKSVISINSCELFAYNEYDENYVISCVNAMQNKVYYAVYKNGVEVVKPAMSDIKDFDRIAENYKGVIISDVEIPGLKISGPENLNFKLGKLSLEKAEKSMAVGYIELQPLYVRLSSAEENLLSPATDEGKRI